MSVHRDEHILTSLHRLVNGVGDSIRELLAESRLLRSRIESNDGVLANFHNQLDSLSQYVNEMDKRLTKLENKWGRPLSELPPIHSESCEDTPHD